MNRFCLVFVFILFSVPSVSASNIVESIWLQQKIIDRFAWDGPVFITSYSLEALRSLGQLRKEITKSIPNKYDGNKLVEFRILTFDGLKYIGWQNDKKELRPETIEIESSRWKILHGLEVGSSASRIIEALGSPTEKAANKITYIGETDEINFSISEGLITKIVFNYYVE